MLQSKLFTKTIRDISKDEMSESAKLLLRAGFVDKLTAGVYTFLPLGLRVLDKIEKIISDEMESISGQRILMPGLIPKANWEKSGRWSNFDALFKLKGQSDTEYALGATHEEVVVPLMKNYISSYKDLPVAVFQIQNKFRNELRVKSGILRTREFLMKDLYSFHATEKDLDDYYEKVKKAYEKIFKRMGIAKETYLTLASGGTFSEFSHEFQTITPAGEDAIFICPKCQTAINKEIIGKTDKCWKCAKNLSQEQKSIEVGNIFKLKEKYTEPFDLSFADKDGKKKLVLMGCYGIGLTRLMGAVVEILHDDKGIIWPESIAPFKIHLIPIESSPKVKKIVQSLYETLQKEKLEVIYDDRQAKSPGEKFADCDLIGGPLRIVVSERTLKKNSIELKKRDEKEGKIIGLKSLVKFLKD
ncbi:MAG: His/Gly/Thr/Pro-type tRNA ligase C-terminal domain-containing protein [Candidatus Nealsonbacteria bacterium]|nr:His/Gly/Thr/Pro-type tRNA ligase C-terminal domain-containing protein [Candidatus Nealsonbacteria bacterium]